MNIIVIGHGMVEQKFLESLYETGMRQIRAAPEERQIRIPIIVQAA